jgi:hypothetical protein
VSDDPHSPRRTVRRHGSGGLLRRFENTFAPGTLERPSGSPPEDDANPLYTDSELFYGYMKLLDEVLEEPEIRSGLSDQNLSPNQMRMMCVARAEDLLREAGPEYAVYDRARVAYQRALSTARRRGRRDAGDRTLRGSSVILGAAGVVAIVVGLAGGHWAHPMAFLWKPGLAALAVGVLARATAYVRLTGPGVRLLGGEIAGESGGDLERARRMLIEAVRGVHLLAFVRTLINQTRASALDDAFAVTASPGLSEVHDSAYHVPTRITAEMDGLIDRLTGGSIGVAGPRGSGKSTLVRGYCEYSGYETGDLRCMVAAPVDYVARDFTLHLFATFCRSALARFGLRRDDSREEASVLAWADALMDVLTNPWCWISAVLLVFHDWIGSLLHQPSGFIVLAALVPLAHGLLDVGSLAVAGRQIAGRARVATLWFGAGLGILRSALWWAATVGVLLYHRHDLAGWLGRSPRFIGYATWALSGLGVLLLARTTLSAVRLVLWSRPVAMRRLAKEAARNLERVRYLQTSTIGWSAGLKLSFGLDGQRTRGLSRAEQPRSYPEIVDDFRAFACEVAEFLYEDGHRVFIGVDELDKIGSAQQAERFLNEIKGVFGIPHTYFLVSVSDDAMTSFERRGLPLRDAFDSSFDEIVRADPLTYAESRRLIYRRVIGLTEPYIALCHCLSGGLARDLIRAARQVVRAGQQETEPGFEEICSAILAEEVRRKLTAAIQVITSIEDAEKAGPLIERLFAVTHRPAAVRPALDLIKEIRTAAPAEPAKVVAVYRDLVAYLYFCTTLQEVFGRPIDTSALVWATADGDRHAGHFDVLAAVRLTLAHSAHVASQSLDRFRDAWSLSPVEHEA